VHLGGLCRQRDTPKGAPQKLYADQLGIGFEGPGLGWGGPAQQNSQHPIASRKLIIISPP
jgi:hypothetical protein